MAARRTWHSPHARAIPRSVRSTNATCERDMNAPTEQTPASGIGRREAIRRAALLAGVALSPQWLTLVDRARPAAQALHLAPEQSAIVSAVADRILPRTDTPGAVDVGVPAFIDLLYGEYMTSPERQLLTD